MRSNDFFILGQRTPQDPRDAVPRDVVLGRTQAAREHDHVRPLERALKHRRQLTDVVAHNSLHADVAADRIQVFGHEQGIGVDAERRQHFGPDGDDAGTPVIEVAKRKDSAQRQVRIDTGHHIVGHDAEAARQPFEPPRRERLDDVGDAEEKESDGRAEPAGGIEEEGDEHPGDLVNHHLPGILPPEMAFCDVSAPRACNDDEHDGTRLNPRGRRQQEPQQQTDGRSPRAGCHRHKPGAECRRESDRDERSRGKAVTGILGHTEARTTRVPANRS